MHSGKFIPLVAVASLVFVGACKKEKETTPAGTVSFTSSILGQTHTRVTGNSWDSGDAIGVFMKQGPGLTNVLAANRKYTTPGNGNFSGSGEDVISYPESGSVDFIAYYPYQEILSGNVLSIDVTDQMNQQGIDVLYSANAVGLDKDSGTPNLDFTHQLTKVELSVDVGSGTSNLDDLTVTFKNVHTTATMNLATGEISNAGSSSDIQAKVTAQGSTQFVEAILIPDDFGLTEVVFTLPSGTFTWTLPINTSFESGKKTTYNILIHSDMPHEPVAVVGEARIIDWITVPVNETVGVLNDALNSESTVILEKLEDFAALDTSYYFYNFVTEDFSAAIESFDAVNREITLIYKETPESAPSVATRNYKIYTDGLILEPSISVGGITIDSIELGALDDFTLKINRAGNAGAGAMGYMHVPPYAFTNTEDRSSSTVDWLLDPARQHLEGSGSGLFMYTQHADASYSDSINFHRAIFGEYIDDHMDGAQGSTRLVNQIYFPASPSLSRNVQISTHRDGGETGNRFFMYGIDLEKINDAPSALKVTLTTPASTIDGHQDAFDDYLKLNFPDEGVTVVPVIVGTTLRLRLISRKDSRFWVEYVLNRGDDRTARFD